MVQAAYASPDSPEESIRQFYTAATAAEKDCAAAMRLRPGFPEERCQKLQAATIRSLQELSNDGTNAAVAADIQVTSNDKPQAFKGTIHLQREQGEWLLKSFDDGKAATTSKVIPLSTEADIIEAAKALIMTHGPDRVRPYMVGACQPSATAAELIQFLNIQSAVTTVSNACPSG